MNACSKFPNRWTENDFEQMSWHDCTIHSISFEQNDIKQDIIFDLDYIVDWLLGDDKTYKFEVAPASLRFHNLDNLHINLHLGFMQPLQIYSIERDEQVKKGYRTFHWLIRIQDYTFPSDRLIEFDADGFEQELVGNSVITKSQSLTKQERQSLKEDFGKKTG